MSGTFTLEQVKKHGKPDDCWIVVNGDVIDCTKYLPNHPGGSLAITAFAGCDCSLEFNTVHDKSMMEQYRDLIIGKVSDGITMEEVAKHGSPNDCWIVVNGEVLDVTDYIKEHPGGELSITAFGGTDCSLEYNTVHAKALIQETCPQCVIGKLLVPKKKKKSKAKAKGVLDMDEVARHNTKEDCWVVVNGFVLAVTPFLPEHPGGPEAILKYAGKDATEEWNMIHSFDVLKQYGGKYIVGKLGDPLGGTADLGLTVEEVAKHNTKQDCWVIINGTVFNLTDWLPLHPGGESVILNYAGKDASDEWNAIHPSGTMEKYGKKYELGPVDSGGTAGPGLTVEDVAKHNTKQDCWVIINGMVYNLTDWLPLHPGGESVILTYAGKDASGEWNLIHPADTIEKYGKKYELGPVASVETEEASADVLDEDEVAKHNTEKDCWIILDGIVYDVTKWLPIHPGGVAAILAYAGKDGTEQFDMIHPEGTMDKYGKAYYVGDLGGPKPNADTGAGLTAPLLDKGGSTVNQWWRDDRNTARQYGPLGPSLSYETRQGLGGVGILVLMLLYEVCATIFSVKNYKVIHDKSGLTRSAAFLLFFTIIHGLGNLHIFAGAPHFNGYGYFLNHPVPWSTLMLPIEVYLLLCGLMHVVVALVRTFKFKRLNMGVDGLWMIISGIFLLAFLVVHLIQFRFVSEAAAPQYYFRTKWMYPFYCSGDDTSCELVHFKDLYKMEFQLFSNPFWVCYYLIGILFFISHAREGLRKMVNSHPVVPRAYKGSTNAVGQVLVVLVGLCYLSFPIYSYFAPERDWNAYDAAQRRLVVGPQ